MALLLILGTFQTIISQELDDNCIQEVDKKTRKLLNEAKNNKKNSQADRISAFQEVLLNYPDNLEANWGIVNVYTKKSRIDNTGYNSSEKYLKKIMDICPNYHSSLYYYLGKIQLGKGNFEQALLYYKKFLAFKGDDKTIFESRYDVFRSEVKKNIKLIKFLKNQYENPVPFSPKSVFYSKKLEDNYLPTVTHDEQNLYYIRRYLIEKNKRKSYIVSDKIDYGDEICFSKKKGEIYNRGKAMLFPFNQYSEWNYTGISLSIDKKQMYIGICKEEQGQINCDIYYSEKISDEDENSQESWTQLQKLSDAINTPDGWEAQPSISSDNQTLMFATKREGTQNIDIFQSIRLPNGDWGTAERVPEPISTEKNDKAPFQHCDNKTLYYASESHLNHGGFDVFCVRKDEHNNWEKPINLGYPINSAGDEYNFVIPAIGDKIFWSTKELDTRSKYKQIYTFFLPKNVRPKKIIYVHGNITTINGLPQDEIQINIVNSVNEDVQKYYISQYANEYHVVATSNSSVFTDIFWGLCVISKGVFFKKYILNLDSSKSYIQDMNIRLEKIEKNRKVAFFPIILDKHNKIDNFSKKILQQWIQWAIKNEVESIELIYHKEIDIEKANQTKAFIQDNTSIDVTIKKEISNIENLEYKIF